MATRSERRHTGLRQRPAREQRLRSPVLQKLRRDRDCAFGLGETGALHEAYWHQVLERQVVVCKALPICRCTPWGNLPQIRGRRYVYARGAVGQDRDLRYRKSKAHILQVRAGWSLGRKSVAKRGDAHTLCCAVRRTKLGCMPPGRPITWKPMAGRGRGLSAGTWSPQQMPLSRG